MDMFNYANDIDMYQEWANVLVHGRFMSEYQRKYHCAYVSRKWSKNYLHSHEQIIAKYQPYIVFHTPMQAIFRNGMGDYGYLVRCETLDTLFEIKDFIHEIV